MTFSIVCYIKICFPLLPLFPLFYGPYLPSLFQPCPSFGAGTATLFVRVVLVFGKSAIATWKLSPALLHPLCPLHPNTIAPLPALDDEDKI